MEKILITGAYGKAVIEALIKLGIKKRQIYALARNASKIGYLKEAGITVVY